jgi:hypothetical protein
VPDRSGARREDQLAYFSSRGGELAKPEIVTPGVAYSTVPRWNTGQEIAQGTSMAAPHAAGLAALLLSAAHQEKRQVEARSIKQALMVTASPLAAATFVDEGTGLPDVERAYRWLTGGRAVAEVSVRAVGNHHDATAALHEVGGGGRAPAVQQFQLLRSQATPDAVYSLRSDSPWLTAPQRVTLKGARTSLDLRYDLSRLKPPGAYVGVVTGWSDDSLAGPAFRLVNTIVMPAPAKSRVTELRSGVQVDPGTSLRTFFRADSARPFEVRVTSGAREKGLAFLHEPDGMPYRDESARPLGGAEGAVYRVDARDVVGGTYEAVAAAVSPTIQSLTAGVRLTQSPFRLHLSRQKNEAVGTVSNVTAASAAAEVAILLGGAERVETVVTRGSATQRIPFIAPRWANGVVVDITMDREQWSKFTDFGVTLFDSAGRQIEKKPLNYAFGRLQASLPSGHGDMPVELALFPGFADAVSDEPWTLRASIRLYADSAVTLAAPGSATASLTVAPGKTAARTFPLAPLPWPVGDGFFPLGVLVVRDGEHTWTREAGLPLPNPAIMR